YVLHELLDFKVNKSRFFRKHINQKLDVIIGFFFFFAGLALQIYLEASALEGSLGRPVLVIVTTVGVMLIIAVLLNRITRYFSGKIYVEHVRFLVQTHGYPLEKDHILVIELGRILKIPRTESETLESYSEKVRAKMGILQDPRARPFS
ncbi:MAG: hypothetical protein ACYTGN_06340, partial [Planctomycetota bacterium]